MKIHSPMARGNGAYVLHQSLAEKIKGYEVKGFNPYLTLFPPILPLLNYRSQPDIIHTTPDYGIFFRKKNIPLIITVHHLVLDAFMRQYSSLVQSIHYQTDLRYYIKKAHEKATIVTSVSHFTADMIRKELGYTDEIRIIYNGIDTEKFKPLPKIKRGPLKILFSGNLINRKGANLLPSIAEKLDDGIEIYYTSGLRTKDIFYNNTKLHSLGSIASADMPATYQKADILLFPTIREGFGLVAAEAMSCGLPVVTTDCSSLPELIINGKGGYLCELGNVSEFAARINQLAASPSLRQEMGEFNRIRVEEKFTLNRMTGEYKSLFEEVLDCKNKK